MARKKKLTPIQEQLLRDAKMYMSENSSIGFDELKSLVNCKSFDSSFNALLHKGYVVHDKKSWIANRNDFKLTD